MRHLWGIRRALLWFCGLSLLLIAFLDYVSFTWAFGVPRQGASWCVDRGELKLYRDAFWEMPNELTMTLILLRDDVDYFPSNYRWPASSSSPSWLPRIRGAESIARANNASFAPVLRSHNGMLTLPMYFFILLAGVTYAYLFFIRNRRRNLVEESSLRRCPRCGGSLSDSASDSCPGCGEKVISHQTPAA